MNHAAPLAPNERILTLDVVRGFALLGIFIMNMPYFGQSFFSEADGSHLWPDATNRAAETLRDMFFSGKFNSMFSLLFGIGFTIQLGRLQEHDPDHALAIYVRRLLILLAVGLAHAILVWNGDVLHVYAVLGLLLLFLRNVSDRTVCAIIAVAIAFPVLANLARLWLFSGDDIKQAVALAQQFEAADNQALGHGTFLDAARATARSFYFFYTDPMLLVGSLNFYAQMVTTMLLGLLVGRHRLVARLDELMPRIRRLQWQALAVGLACAVVYGVGGQYVKPFEASLLKMIVGLAYVACRLGLMIFYVLTIVRAAQSPTWRPRLAPMAAAGRMPLTNYLLQTLLATSIFYGWGLGYWLQIGPAGELLLAIALFFAIQMPLSVLWFKRFDYGPLEYLWRTLTYGRRPARAVAAISPSA